MKLSKPLSALILIASALLLSADATVTAESPSQPNQSTNTNQTAPAESAVPHPSITQIIQPTVKPTADERTGSTHDQGERASPNGNDLPEWLQAIATILLVAFAAYQMRFMKRATGATEASANAARESASAAKFSADVAERALHINRPFLLSRAVDLKNFHSDSRHVAVAFTIKNWGTRPAFISGISARLGITSTIGDFPVATDGTPAPFWRKPEPTNYPHDLDHGWAIHLENDVVEPSEESPSYQVELSVETNEVDVDQLPMPIGLGHLVPELFQRMTESNLDKYGPTPDIQITLKGIVRYHDASLKEYWTEFCWDYYPNSIWSPKSIDAGRFEVRYHRDSEERRSAPV